MRFVKRLIHWLRHVSGLVRCEFDTQIVSMNGANYFIHTTRCVECGHVVSSFIGRNIGRQQIIDAPVKRESDFVFRKHWVVGVMEQSCPVLWQEVPVAARAKIMNGARFANADGESVSSADVHRFAVIYSGEEAK